MNKYNHVNFFKEKYKESAVEMENTKVFTDVKKIYLSVEENNTKYIVIIGSFKDLTPPSANINKCFYEAWYKEISNKEVSAHRLLLPAKIAIDINGNIINERYFLDNKMYSKKYFFEHPLNKELIIAKRFNIQPR